jgi:hypothetical protein
MRVDLWRRKSLFKAKSQPSNTSNDHGGDKWHNTAVDGRMHNGEVKIISQLVNIAIIGMYI